MKEAKPELCHICDDESSWVRYSLEEVRGAFRDAPARSRPRNRSAAPAPDSSLPDDRLREIWSPAELNKRRVSKPVVEAITTGKWKVRTGVNAGREDDQSSRDNMIANTLLELEFTEDEIADIFRAYPGGCGSKVADPKHGEIYLDRTIKAAVRNQKEKGRTGGNNGKGTSAKTKPAAGPERAVGVGSNGASAADDLPEGFEGGNGLPSYYEFHADGSVWHHRPMSDWDKSLPKPEQVSSSFMRIVEIHENIDTGQLSASVEYKYGNAVRVTTIPRAQMVEARSLVTALGGAGAPVTSNNARKVVSYLADYETCFIDQIPKKLFEN